MPLGGAWGGTGMRLCANFTKCPPGWFARAAVVVTIGDWGLLKSGELPAALELKQESRGGHRRFAIVSIGGYVELGAYIRANVRKRGASWPPF